MPLRDPIPEVATGDPITADTFNKLILGVNTSRIVGGRGIKVSESDAGTVVEADGSPTDSGGGGLTQGVTDTITVITAITLSLSGLLIDSVTLTIASGVITAVTENEQQVIEVSQSKETPCDTPGS